MDKIKLIEKLNEAISLELGALLQYNQYSHVIAGRDRIVWADWFEDQCKESLSHAKKFAAKVVALGGTPSVEPDAVKQTLDLQEMLENSLATERRAVKVYTEALKHCEDSPAYRTLLEDQILDESEDVEELEKLLNQITKVAGATGKKQTKKSG